LQYISFGHYSFGFLETSTPKLLVENDGDGLDSYQISLETQLYKNCKSYNICYRLRIDDHVSPWKFKRAELHVQEVLADPP
jgi:hypothetical protein